VGFGGWCAAVGTGGGDGGVEGGAGGEEVGEFWGGRHVWWGLMVVDGFEMSGEGVLVRDGWVRKVEK